MAEPSLLEPMSTRSLNAVFTNPSMRRRYEVWFLRLGLADGSGAWWFRYLLMNPGAPAGEGDAACPERQPGQIWATWFPDGGEPETYVQGFSKRALSLGRSPTRSFKLEFDGNAIGEDFCLGALNVRGHAISWSLRYRSAAAFALSGKGWIGFSRTPHADAIFSGEVQLDGRLFRGDPLGYGVQGHNCGYRHLGFWTWAHSIAQDTPGEGITALEALEYKMPFGLRFQKAVLWREGKLTSFQRLKSVERDYRNLRWVFNCRESHGSTFLRAIFDGGGRSAHRVRYWKTDRSGSFEVANNSVARAELELVCPGQPAKTLRTDRGAVIEMAGE